MEVALSLDVNKDRGRFTRPKKVYVRKGEQGNTLIAFTVTKDGSPYDLTDLTVRFMAALADGRICAEDALITSAQTGSASIVLPDASVSVVGPVAAYIALVREGYCETTETFVIDVERCVDLEGEQAQGYVLLIDKMLAQLDEQKAAMEAATAECESRADQAIAEVEAALAEFVPVTGEEIDEMFE